MELDVFFSISQTEVNGYMPSERVMFENFFEQVILADRLGFGTAWVAESHLSTEVQKTNRGAVIPHFVGEIGLNTDILQLGHRIFARTKQIGVGSAIMNILCNGGPIAAAERIKTFLALHGLDPKERRLLTIGFAAGRFPFINIPYGIVPRTPVEEAAWPVVKNKIFEEATEIFLRLLRGETLSSSMIANRSLQPKDFRSDGDWQRVVDACGQSADEIPLAPRWVFPNLKIVPRESRMELLRLSIGSHDAATQVFANTILPVGVFNLSITPGDEIQKTNERMATAYHPDGGGWQRRLMPRTVLVFIHDDPPRAAEEARAALINYWRALEGTLDEVKVQRATENALIGNAEMIAKQITERFHPDDRLMLWFDFNNHDSKRVMKNMEDFMTKVAPGMSR
ncbi:MAG TPA: LLM class flavin-dependent oxidoreductase [Thermoanaerobaculia bacterium]|jgi:alkanesulfonate monooxygenase SsuD/methylene tetrahydromethanopterin reductase-like flavin-dependent oxidoreductase (luciferase family)|nr:LLM class flavin-dependent oxidoreductase [Thermoanaerobaculia bacterium]